MKTKILALCFLLALLVRAVPTTAEPLDRERARQLHRRVVSGEKLSPEDQAYYERFMAERQRPQAAGNPAPAASAAGAGDIDREKAQAIRQRRRKGEKPSAKDDGQTKVTRPEVSETACPLDVISAPTPDKNKATAVVRKPPGKGPFPAIVFLHGGMEEHDVKELERTARNQVTQARFLAAGYVMVGATFRSRRADPQTRDALVDCLAIIAEVKKMPEVDPMSVVLFGGSGGGSLALELAGESQLCAVAAGEPACVLLTGMMTKEQRGLQPIMENPKAYYTPELQKFTRDKIRKIGCPVLIVHGDQHPINKINEVIIIPEMKAAGKKVEEIVYPGQPHGFYWGSGTPEAALKCFEDTHAFFKKHLPTQPKPLDESLVKQVPVGRAVETGDK